MKPKTKRILLGIAGANLMGLGVILLTWGLMSLAVAYKVGSNENIFSFASSDFILVPMAMGALMAYLWHNQELSRAESVGYSFLSLAISYSLCALVLKEGTICLLMALPLVVLFQWLGYLIGKVLANRRNNRLNSTLAPLFLALIVANVLTTQGYDGQVTDRILIHAPPRKVWRYIAGYPAITAPPDYWLWKIGLPAPAQSTATGYKIGAQRRCIFSGNIVVDERITRMTPKRELTFDVTAQPKDPEVSGHFALHRGQFLLQDNGDGTTTLTGISWYTLNVHPACYYDLWVQDIVRYVHLRVMYHIKTLAESAP